MATILLSAAGAAVGGAVGGSVLGLSSVVLGRAAGATLGRVLDQRLLGAGSATVETGRLDRYRITGANEGAALGRVFGRMRVGGQVIWATRFREHVETERASGGKGAPRQPATRRYSYSVSLAVALCEGEIQRVGRIWADGIEIAPAEMNLRVHRGTEDQQPDSLIEAVEGAGNAPAYRGTAYVVIEDLELSAYGNRVPQFSFEVVRAADPGPALAGASRLSDAVPGVALVPGSGEYALATTPVHYGGGLGRSQPANVNSPSGRTDFETSLTQLVEEAPACASALLVVCWFGDDLRVNLCQLKPKVEQAEFDAEAMHWTVSGLTRTSAEVVAELDDRPVYGGTPTDQSVIEAIRALREAGQAVVFYPFILMEPMAGNELIDPWTGQPGQPPLPWRGRITTSLAPGVAGTPDRTTEAETEVAAFFGAAAPEDFVPAGDRVGYDGPAEWSYRRFILHYAHLCALAGGVDAFCIGSEMRGLTRIRGAGDSFPAVERMRALLAEVRGILPDSKLGYAADWSEYFGYHPQDGSGDVHFHLDPLWSDHDCDFIGIDNYMPLSDWRDGDDHLDAHWGSIHDLDYLKANIAGGEGFDWYYASVADREAQIRTPITDGSGASMPTPDRSFAPSSTIGDAEFGGHATRSADATFEADVVLPADPTDGVLFERGGNWRGAMLGLRDGGTVLRLRAGGGGAKSASDTETALLDLAVADLPFDGQTHRLRWDFRISPGRVRLFVDGALAGEAFISGGGDLPGAWSGSGPGFYGDGMTDIAGEPHGGWPAAVAGDLRMWDRIEAAVADPQPWVYRYKALKEWWSNPHHDRRDGRPVAQASPWVPRSKPIWFTELGCAAIDKGTNQPNKFLDPKSSESSLPHHSDGSRDDLIQAQYLRAMWEFWGEAANNPVSDLYGGPMVDMSRAHVWAWDTRPYPHFPGLSDLWTDAENYMRGHWLNGRITTQPLGAVVAEICDRSGVAEIDVSDLRGGVRGYHVADTGDARAALQPLMLTHAFEAVEREGTLHFRMRGAAPAAALEEGGLALSADLGTAIERQRAPEAEMAGRVRLTHVAADADFEAAATEAVFPGDSLQTVSRTELPVALTHAEGRAVVERWLVEARIARDSARFALPPSEWGLGAGDVVTLPEPDGPALYRIDHVDQGSERLVEAVRVEPSVYRPATSVSGESTPRRFAAPAPVHAVFLDLPLLTGREDPNAPHLAVTAAPWPGAVAVHSAPADAGYALNTVVDGASVIGLTETPLPAARPGLWDRGPALRVRLGGGVLSSAEPAALMAGANAMAIGDGGPDPWEVFQFAEAVLVGPDCYELRTRLRGQLGTDALVPAEWPVGSTVVLLNGAAQQIALSPAERGLEQHYRIGPAARPLDDPSYRHRVESFAGNGWRPYAPAHLRAARQGSDLAFAWVRRTRIEGDSWASVDVPLGEERERYLVQVLSGGKVAREQICDAPSWTYAATEQAADGVAAPFAVQVAQISERYGPGPFRRIDIDE